MREIVMVPAWMGEQHWVVMATLFWGLSAYCWILNYERSNALSMAYAILFTSAAMIASMFWLVQSDVTPIEEWILFAVERAFWWPMAFAAFVVVDIHAADFNGHRSVIARIHRRFQNRRSTHVHSAK